MIGMRKVMVVDDEKWIRRGLIQSIDWERFGLELAGEASDGEEAYELALALKPELLFLDMRMPGLDGKQLLGLLKQSLPETLTIVVSGYSDFEYTKEAIRQKAYDYLLKPVKKEELNAVLDRAVQELDRRSAEQGKAAGTSEEWLSRYLLNSGDSAQTGTTPKEQSLPAEWQEGQYAVAVCRADIFAEQEAAPITQLLAEQLTRQRPFLLGGSFRFAAAATPGDARETVIAFCAAKLTLTELQLLHKTMHSAVQRVAGGGTYSFGFSHIKLGPQQLGEAFREAKQALRGRRLAETASVLFAGLAQLAHTSAYPQEEENALWLALQAGSCDAAAREFDRWFEAAGAAFLTVEQLQHNAIVLVHAMNKHLQSKSTLLEEVCGKKLSVLTERILHRHDCASVRELLEQELLSAVLAYFGRSSEKQSELIVMELTKLIETQYDRPLSLHHIAGTHYMNPDYLSRLFKKVTGKNFVDYVADVRIGKAKELLRLSKYKNYEIAQKVGYEDYRYFSQIFKKKVGMTIGEYRSRFVEAEPTGGETIYDQTLHS
jgi:two-component system, response regulator YesN